MARILVIDDDAAARVGVARYLRFAGHEALEAGDGLEGLAIVRRSAPDLVITDINMPGADGIEVILALMESLPELPVIAISGGGLVPKELLLSSAEGLGALRTLAKPFELGELRAAVAEALGRGSSGGVMP